MKERPILMTPENAQKCHDGTKTQTRRIVKLPAWSTEVAEDNALSCVPFCPYGQVGDRLWVREALCRNGSVMTYRDGSLVMQGDLVMPSWCERKTIPSIHMPRWACRTVLEITEVRVERVKDISPADALPEGSDFPMRVAITEAYRKLTGREPNFLFSGWGEQLTELERAVVENRMSMHE